MVDVNNVIEDIDINNKDNEGKDSKEIKENWTLTPSKVDYFNSSITTIKVDEIEYFVVIYLSI